MNNLEKEDKQMESIFEREARLKKIALNLYEKCKSENLTVSDFVRLLDILSGIVAKETKL